MLLLPTWAGAQGPLCGHLCGPSSQAPPVRTWCSGPQPPLGGEMEGTNYHLGEGPWVTSVGAPPSVGTRSASKPGQGCRQQEV